MEDPNLRLLSVVAVNSLHNEVVVADQSRDVVVFDGADGVPAVISEVMDNEVEIVGQKGPKGVVEINCQTVAMAQDKAWTLPDFRDAGW